MKRLFNSYITLFFFLFTILASIKATLHAESSEDRSLGSKLKLQIYPTSGYYLPYIADPRGSRSGVQIFKIIDSEIPKSGKHRFNLTAGGRFDLLKLYPPSLPDSGLSLSIEGSILAQFNMDSKQDNIGWDGFYGLLIGIKLSSILQFKIAALHDSSHVGDEYIETTGKKRINYTREELAFGISLYPLPFLRSYFEIGKIEAKGMDEQKPTRLQAGAEYVNRNSFFEN